MSLRRFNMINPLIYWIVVVYFITRIIEQATNTSSFWPKVWNRIVDLNDDEFYFKVFVAMIYSTLLYWAVGVIYLVMSLTKKPVFLQKYRTQPETHQALKLRELTPVIVNVLFNQLCLNVTVAYIVSVTEKDFIKFPPLRETSSFQRFMSDLVLYEVVYEICFYSAHRLFHTKIFYKHFHKKHHEWTAPISITAIYAHPVEHVIANLMPIILPTAILKLPLSTTWVAMSLTIVSTVGDHSGYHLPFLHSPQFHDYHHLKFSECYGARGFIDKIFGTCRKFEQSIQSKRHMTLLSLKPASELYPEVSGREKKSFVQQQ